MAQFLDYDPLRGMAEYEDKTQEGAMQIHYRQDVETLLNANKADRDAGATDSGIKRDMWLYARIPPVVILKLKFEYGVDIFKKDHLKRAFDIINRDFPYLKCTEKHHDLKGKGYGL